MIKSTKLDLCHVVNSSSFVPWKINGYKFGDNILLVVMPKHVFLLCRLLGIIENHRRVWSLSNRPGGLEESIKTLQKVFDEIVPSSTLTV